MRSTNQQPLLVLRRESRNSDRLQLPTCGTARDARFVVKLRSLHLHCLLRLGRWFGIWCCGFGEVDIAYRYTCLGEAHRDAHNHRNKHAQKECGPHQGVEPFLPVGSVVNEGLSHPYKLRNVRPYLRGVGRAAALKTSEPDNVFP